MRLIRIMGIAALEDARAMAEEAGMAIPKKAEAVGMAMGAAAASRVRGVDG